MTSLQARVVAKSIRAANSRNTPAPSSSKRTVSIYVVSLHISLAGLLYGLDTGSIGPITEMQQFLDSMGELSDSTQGWYVSSVLLFAALSSVADGYLADMFSRKYTIFFGAILAFIGALQSASSSNLRQLFIARAIYGVGIGISLGTSVVYLVEIAPATHRGRFGCMSQLLITVGIAVAYLTASQSSKLPDSAAWRVPFMVQASVALVLAAGIPFLPYSPRWLMQNGREAEAELTLLKLRNVSPTDVAGLESVKGVLNDIRNDIQLNQFAQRKTSFAEIFHRPIRRPTLLSLFVIAHQQLTGIDVILYFAPIIFTQAGFPSRQASFHASGISGLINLCFTIPALIYVDRVGRRITLLIGGSIISFSLLTLGCLYAFNGTKLPDGSMGLVSSVAQYLALISIYLVVASFSGTWGIVGRLYNAEIIPTLYRARTCVIQQFMSYTTNFVVTLTAPNFLNGKNASWPYFTYGALTLWAVIVLCIWMPETKGKRLERMAEVFELPEVSDVDPRASVTTGSGRATPVGGLGQRRKTAMERRGSYA